MVKISLKFWSFSQPFLANLSHFGVKVGFWWQISKLFFSQEKPNFFWIIFNSKISNFSKFEMCRKKRRKPALFSTEKPEPARLKRDFGMGCDFREVLLFEIVGQHYWRLFSRNSFKKRQFWKFLFQFSPQSHFLSIDRSQRILFKVKIMEWDEKRELKKF